MAATKLDSLYVAGTLQAGNYVNLGREGFKVSENDFFPIDLQSFRIWDAFQTLLTTSASDDLGITAGAFGTGCPYITTGDVKNTSGTRYARAFVQLPMEYAQGDDVALAINAGTLTTIASGSVTLDVEVYKAALDTLKTGSDLYAGAAISINSTTFNEISFPLSASGLNPGDWLDIRIAIAWVDVATGTVVQPSIAAVNLVCSTKG